MVSNLMLEKEISTSPLEHDVACFLGWREEAMPLGPCAQPVLAAVCC